MTFCNCEEGVPSSKRPHRESQGDSTRAQLDGDNVGPLSAQRPGLKHFQEMPPTCWGTRDRQGHPLEPSIKNYELWPDWQACQLDMPHWWEELTAIPEAGDPKKLTWKIKASFNIPAVRCKALQNQDYTGTLALQCLTRGSRFLSNDPSYQDVRQKPLLLTLAYAQALPY